MVLGVWIVLAHRVEKRVLQDVQILVGRDGSADSSAQEDDQEQSEVEEDQESVFLFKKKHFNHKDNLQAGTKQFKIFYILLNLIIHIDISIAMIQLFFNNFSAKKSIA